MRKLPYLFLAFLLLTSTTLLAQKKDSNVSISIHDDDVDIDIDIDDIGDIIEEAFASLDGDFSVHIDDDDIDIRINDVDIDWDEFEDDIEHAVETAVRKMKIEIRDIEVRDIEEGDSRFNGTDLRDIIDDIEDEYNRDVKKIDRMVLQFDKHYTLITMDVTLENGKEIRNIKTKIRD